MPRPARRRSAGPPPADRPAPAELILSAAQEIDRVPTTLDAELLLSTLLGTAWSRSAPDRAAGLDAVVEALTERVAGADAGPAGRIAALLSGPGTARATEGYAYGDRYGDQTGYVVRVEDDGGDHALVLFVDHTLGLVRDIVVVAPASAVLDQLPAGTDDMSWSAPMEPGAVRVATAPYLRATDLADELPDAGSLADSRWLAGRRLAQLPEVTTEPAPAPDRDELVTAFVASPEARIAGLTRGSDAHREAVAYGLGLCVDFAATRGGDPLRWSPRAVEGFLLDWVHQRAVLDARDLAVLPDVLAAWVSWAGRRIGLPDDAVAATLDRIDALRAEFARLGATGEKQSPAVRATAQLVAEGVDLADPAAVERWLAGYNASH